MTLIFMVALPFLSIAGLILFAVNRLKIHFTIAPLFSLSFIIVILYLFTLFSIAQVGIYLIFVINSAFILDFIVSFLRRAEWIRNNAETLIALTFYSVILLVLTLLSRRWYFQCWDEYMHWDPFVRHIYKTNGFFTSGSYFIHAHYVQGLPLLAVYFAKLGSYTDGTLILSNNILLLSSFFVFLRNWGKRIDVLLNGIRLILYYLLVNTFSVLLVNTFIADIIIGAVAAAIVYMLYNDRSTRSMVIVTPILLGYVFLKDVCIYFAVWILFSFALWDFLACRDLALQKRFVLVIKKYLPLLIAVFAWYGVWVLRLRMMNIHSDMRILLNVRELWIAFFTHENAFYQSVMDNFYAQLLHFRFVRSLPMSWLFVIFVMLIPVSAIVFPNGFRRKEIFLSLALAVSFLGYAFLLAATFLGTRREGQLVYEESAGLFLRYFSSFCVLYMLILFNFIGNAFLHGDAVEKGPRFRMIQTLFMVMVSIFVSCNALTEYRIANFFPTPDHRWEKAKAMHRKFGGVFEENSKALIINFDNDELEWLMINAVFAGEGVTFVRERMDYSVDNTSPYDFSSRFQWTDTDYLFLYKSSEMFWSGYSGLFEDDPNVRDINPMIFRFDREKQLFTFVAK